MKGAATGDLCVLKVDGKDIWTVSICESHVPELLARFSSAGEALQYAAAERERRFGGDREPCNIAVPDECPCHGRIGVAGTIAVEGQLKEM